VTLYMLMAAMLHARGKAIAWMERRAYCFKKFAVLNDHIIGRDDELSVRRKARPRIHSPICHFLHGFPESDGGRDADHKVDYHVHDVHDHDDGLVLS